MSYGGDDNGVGGSSIGIWLVSMLGLFVGIVGSCIMLVVLKHRVVSGEKGEVDDGEANHPSAQKEQPQPLFFTAENFHTNCAQTLYTTGRTNQDVGYMHVHAVRKNAESTNAPTPTTAAISETISETTNTLHDTIAATDYSHYLNCQLVRRETPSPSLPDSQPNRDAAAIALASMARGATSSTNTTTVVIAPYAGLGPAPILPPKPRAPTRSVLKGKIESPGSNGSKAAYKLTFKNANSRIVSDNKTDSVVILGKRITINRDKGVSNVLTQSRQSNLCTIKNTDKTPYLDQYSSQDVQAVALEVISSATPHPLADIIGDYGNRADTIRKWFAAHQNHHSALLSPHDLASVLAQIILSLQEEKALVRDTAAELVRAAGVLAEEMHRWRRGSVTSAHAVAARKVCGREGDAISRALQPFLRDVENWTAAPPLFDPVPPPCHSNDQGERALRRRHGVFHQHGSTGGNHEHMEP